MNIVGLDLGAGALKLVNCDGPLTTLSHVALNGAARVDQSALGFARRKKPLHISGDFGSFYVGEGAHDYGSPVERLDVDRFASAPDMRALVYGGLNLIRRDEPIHIYVGLPQNIAIGEQASANIAAVKSWLSGAHEWVADGKPARLNIASVVATSQPRGAYMDALLGDAGQLRPDRRAWKSAEIGVISIGFNTLELLALSGGEPVAKFASSDTIGVRSLLRQCDPARRYSLGELDIRLRAGRLDTSTALPVWASEIAGRIEAVWGEAHTRFTAVLAVGGGAILLRDELVRRFGARLIVPDDPVLAVARGLYRFGLSRHVKTS